MTVSTTSVPAAALTDDCPLPVGVQRRNIACFVAYWSIFYFCAPVTYVGLTHANLLKALGNSDTISNLPAAMYLWLTIVPVAVAWMFPHPKHLKPLILIAIGSMSAMTAAVAVSLGLGATTSVVTLVVIGHGAVFGAVSGVLLTALWDALKRGVSTSRRGTALGFTFGIGPLFACGGALLQDAVFDGRLLGGRSFGLGYPNNYLTLFAAVAPVLLLAGVVMRSFTIPESLDAAVDPGPPLAEIQAGVRQFFQNRSVWFAVAIYVLVYSGGNAIFSNVSLHAQSVLGEESNTLGLQSFLRFGFKAVAGALLGWLLSSASPRATLMATTSILFLGMTWALVSTGWWFMGAFGLLGAGELFGAYFPNYVATASRRKFVRVNIAFLSVLSALTGFSSLAFGIVSDRYGRMASFYVAAGMLAFALVLIRLLPADPTPKESEPIAGTGSTVGP